MDVTGIVDGSCSSPERQATSVGSEQFTFELFNEGKGVCARRFNHRTKQTDPERGSRHDPKKAAVCSMLSCVRIGTMRQ